MDDSANVDLVDVSPIGSPNHFLITTKQLWRGGESHSDDEAEDVGNAADESTYHHGSSQWLPRPLRGFRRLKPLTLEINLPPPFLHSPGYLPTVEITPPPPLSYSPDYFDLSGKSPLELAEVDDNIRFQHYPRLSIYDPDEFDGTHTWNPRSHLSALWDTSDDSDDESSDESKGYITFTGQSASTPSEFGLGIRQFNFSEPSAFVLDFPEDVGESQEHDTVSADSDPGAIGHFGPPVQAPPSERPVKSPVQTLTREDPQSTPISAPSALLPWIRKLSGEKDGLGVVPHTGSGVVDADVPVNVPLSPLVLMTDGFPGHTSPPHSDLVGLQADGSSTNGEWLEGFWEETICGSCLEDDLMEWDHWCEQLVEGLGRDLDSWASFRDSARTGVDKC